MADEVNLDPYGSYFFALEINGVEVAHFTECSGLKSTAEVFEIQEGGLNGRVHKFPGQSRWENLTLRYALSTSTALLEWRDRYLQDKFEERVDTKKNSGSIKIMNNKGEVVRRFNFTNAWPVSWEGPSVNATSSDVAMESLEIAHEGLTVELS